MCTLDAQTGPVRSSSQIWNTRRITYVAHTMHISPGLEPWQPKPTAPSRLEVGSLQVDFLFDDEPAYK